MTLLALRWPRRRSASLLFSVVCACGPSFSVPDAADSSEADAAEPVADANSDGTASDDTGAYDETGALSQGSAGASGEPDSADGPWEATLDAAASAEAATLDVTARADATVDGAVSADATAAPTLLDDFNRPDGPVLGAWAGNDLDAFAIEGGRLVVKKEGCYTIYFASPIRHLAQQARVTLKQIPDAAGETNLVLRARTATGCDLIEANYQPSKRLVGVFGCDESTSGTVWTDGGPQTAAVFLPEHVLAATLDENGSVSMFDGNVQLASYVAPNWASLGSSRGSIGISVCDAMGAEFDDFGGVP